MEKKTNWMWIVVVIIIAVIAGVWLMRGNDVTTDTTDVNNPDTAAETGTTPVAAGTDSGAVERTASGAIIVHYYNSGFSPKMITIAKGTTVHFANDSMDALRITAVDQVSQPSAGLEQGKSVDASGSYEYNFNQVGSYTYYNMNNKEESGVVIVK